MLKKDDPGRSRSIRSLAATMSALLALILILPSISIAARHVDLIVIDSPITPVSAKYISDGIRQAEKDSAEALIIQMDTPGGLMQATWSIDKEILAAEIPVIVYIYPSGGRAASAGVFISYAAHLVAMAPSTNIGSAHPVTMGGEDSSKVMTEKVTNDAVAHIKGLAEKRGRNAKWAEEAVRKSVNITEKEAVKLKVADIISGNLEELLEKLDGKRVVLEDGEVTLRVKGASILRKPMTWWHKVLDQISHPNIAYLLMIFGFYGILFELRSPGAVFPGVFGAICLVMAFFALQVLSINTSGFLLILLGFVFWILEAFVPGFGILAAGGLVSFVLGSMMLFKTPEVKVSLALIITMTVCTALFLFIGTFLALRTRFTRATTGKQGLVGEIGIVVNPLKPEGQVSVHGEVWKAVSSENLKEGEKVVVTAVDGLKIQVKRVKDKKK
jgi:membrane-bound serine protease (ClpP class)